MHIFVEPVTYVFNVVDDGILTVSVTDNNSS